MAPDRPDQHPRSGRIRLRRRRRRRRNPPTLPAPLAGYANQWGFAIYRASHDDYEDSYLPTGYSGGTAEDALDTACGLYLNDPTGWLTPPTN